MNLSQTSDGELAKKLKKLSKAQLEHAVQTLRDDVRRAEHSVRNYPEDRMEKYGKPFLKRLQGKLAMAEAALANK